MTVAVVFTRGSTVTMIFIFFFYVSVGGFVLPNTIFARQVVDNDDSAGFGLSLRSVNDGHSYIVPTITYPRDCAEVYDNNCANETSGVFLIQPDGAEEPFQIYCNSSIDGGKWTVFQRRLDGSIEFYRGWTEYKNGFGFLNREFWLGNDKISLLTNQKNYELRIDMNDSLGTPYYAKYSLFRISDEFSKFRLVSIGTFDGTSTAVHDRMSNHLNRSFTTFDNDNDIYEDGNNAVFCRGAWWYSTDCKSIDNNISNLNGLYSAGSSGCMSIYWDDLGPHANQINIKFTEMKIRPVP